MQFNSQLLTLREERTHVCCRVETRALGRVQARDPSRMRLDRADLVRINDAALHTISLSSAMKFQQRCALGFAPSHDQNAPLDHGDLALPAVRAQAPATLDTILRLERAGLEIVARVNHAAVTPALVSGRPRFLLENDDACACPSEM